ncbi:hypothetical protein TrLO_g12495 [Triparma laevis f. longispina]|uniref:FHA domain-containing protein n=1 Tax=Triparma laevis f. longispina TaxID=1714387 RepID=A0A9W7KZS4_9STRA|nr:hypothetical protein TrLO_g12495 [Triparma laevis f. longispina]
MDLIGQITVIKRSGRDGATLDWSLDKSSLLIGRHEDCDIRVQLPTVSRRHASFLFDDKSKVVCIKDHSSVNTTTVNNVAIKGRTVIKHGDKITFGDRSFRFEYSSGSTPSTSSLNYPDSENVQPNTVDLEGDATQDISKFVRVGASGRRVGGGGTMETVKESEASATETKPKLLAEKNEEKKSLPTPIKNSISSLPQKSSNKIKKPLNTPLKNSLSSFSHSTLRTRTLGTSVAVLDSFKLSCPTKKLPSPLRKAIVEKRKSLSEMYKVPRKALNTPIKKQLKKTSFHSQKYSAPPSLQTPVKRAITELRRRKSLGLKKVPLPMPDTTLPKTPSNLNAEALTASAIPLPESVIKNTPVKTMSKSLPTPVRISINARYKKTPAKSKTPAKIKLPNKLLEAIKARSSGEVMEHEVKDKNTVDFVSDKLMVESYARELEGVVETTKPVAVSCALDAYMDSVTEEVTEVKPLRSLPFDLRKSIMALNVEVEGKVGTPLKEVVGITVPPTPATPDFGEDLETMFEQRPEDVALIEESVKDFSEKAGLEEKVAYGYALDAYLEGVNEFWGHVETIQEEEDEEVEEEEVEEEEELPPMADDEEEQIVDVEKRQSLAKDLAKGLCDIFDDAAQPTTQPKQTEIANTVAHSMCELLTATAMENVKNKAKASQAVAQISDIAEDMGESLSALFKSAKKSKKRMSLAADMADSLTDLFKLKDELEATSPKAIKKGQDKRKSLAADMAESLVGLFSSPAPVAMASGKQSKADRRTSLAADMGSSLDALFSETSTEPVVEEIKETLVSLLEGSEKSDKETMKGSEIVANCLVELLETTAAIVKEDEKKAKKTKVKGRRTSMKRVSLAGDIGDSLNNMFGETEEEEEEEQEAVVTLLNDVEAVVDEIVSEVEEPTCLDKSLAIGQAVDVLLDGAVHQEVVEEKVVEEEVVAMEEEEVEEEEEIPDFKNMKVAELREECSKRDLDTTGIKKTLIKRLTDFVESPASPNKRSIDEVDGEVEEQESKKAAVEESVEESVEEVDFKSLKVADLRKECTSRNLDTKGTKAVLIKRLEEAVQGGDEEQESSEEEQEEEGMDVEETDEETVDFKSLKVPDLRKECTTRNLDTKGAKAVLIKRLEEFVSGDAEEEVESSEEESEEEEETIDFKSMKVAELRAECSKRDLDTKGVKAALIKRLEAAC